MNLNWDAISGVTQIITVLYLFYQFHYLPNKAQKEAIENIRVLFITSQKKVENLIAALASHCEQHNCEHLEFLNGATFKSQLLQLLHLQENDLNNDVLENVLKMAKSDALMATIVESINAQINSFTQLEAYFNTNFKWKQF